MFGTPSLNPAAIVGTGSFVMPIKAETANYQMLGSDYTVTCDPTGAAFTVTLPAVPAIGQIVNVCRINTVANAVTVQGSGGALINGQASLQLTSADIAFVFQWNGAQWNILSLT